MRSRKRTDSTPSHMADVVDRGWLLSMMGNADESVRIAERALAAEPGLDRNRRRSRLRAPDGARRYRHVRARAGDPRRGHRSDDRVSLTGTTTDFSAAM